MSPSPSPPLLPLVDGMAVLTVALRSRSFRRRKQALGDDIAIDISLVSPHYPSYGKDERLLRLFYMPGGKSCSGFLV